MSTPDNVLMCRVLKAIVDSLIGPTMDLMARSPAPVQTPPSSMNVAVNVSAVNPESSGWWQTSSEQGWAAWNPPREAISYNDNADAQWKSFHMGRDAWRSHGYNDFQKKQKDRGSQSWGNTKSWKAVQDQWKAQHDDEAQVTPDVAVPGEAPAAGSFIIPCRHYSWGRCKLGDSCKFSHSLLTTVSDDLFEHFIKLYCPSANDDDLEHLRKLSPLDKLAVVNAGEMYKVQNVRFCAAGRIKRSRQIEAPLQGTSEQQDRPYQADRNLRPRSRSRSRSYRSSRALRKSNKLVSDPPGLVVQTGDRREDGMGATVPTPLHNQAAEVVESVSRNNSHAVDLGIVTDEAMLQEVTSKLRSEASASSNIATIHQASFSAALRSADSVKENQNASAQSSPSASLIAKQFTSGDANSRNLTENLRSPCSKSESGTREDRALRADHSSSQDKKVQAPSSLMGGFTHHVKPTPCVHEDPATTTGPVNNLKDETITQGNSSLSSRSTSLVHHHGYHDRAEYKIMS